MTKKRALGGGCQGKSARLNTLRVGSTMLSPSRLPVEPHRKSTVKSNSKDFLVLRVIPVPNNNNNCKGTYNTLGTRYGPHSNKAPRYEPTRRCHTVTYYKRKFLSNLETESESRREGVGGKQIEV
eukprot:7284631-Pyramimonas_sp.AAC.1